MTCTAKMRPFVPVNDTELTCDRQAHTDTTHEATLRDYAYPGSETKISWQESDRRTFRGDWAPCTLHPGCILPALHHGNHAE